MPQLNEKGHEVLDPTPIAIPVGFKLPESMTDMVRRFVRHELSRQADEKGFETFEESDDFDIEDDPPLPETKWELNYDQETAPRKPARSAAKRGKSPDQGHDKPGNGEGAQPAAGTPKEPAKAGSVPAESPAK